MILPDRANCYDIFELDVDLRFIRRYTTDWFDGLISIFP